MFVAYATLSAGQAPAPNVQSAIKIGFIAPLSGPYAQNGRDILNGLLLYLEQVGYRAGGRSIELIVEDDEAIPAVGLTKARKLVERDKVHVMAGALLSSTGYALAPCIDSMRIPMVYPVVSADDLTQRRRSKWIVRTGYSGSQPNHAFGEYAARSLKLRRVATIALDYAFGWESVGGFQRTFEAEGGTIVQKIWCPVSVHDFAPYLAQVSRDVDYGDSHVLQGVSLQAEKGTVAAVVGRNGVGKTTLCRPIVGLTAARSGRVVFNEIEITGVPPHRIWRMRIGLVPQGRRIFSSLTVHENLAIAVHPGSDARAWDLEKVLAVFPRLAERRRHRGNELSGGEQQMLAIARALVANPVLLVMDEPTEGLAPALVSEVASLIRRLKDEGRSVLLVEQNAAFAVKVADHVHVMSKGRIVHSSEPAALWANEEIKTQFLGVPLARKLRRP